MFTQNYINFKTGQFTGLGSSSSEMFRVTGVDGTSNSCFSSRIGDCDIGGWLTIARCKAFNTESQASAWKCGGGVWFGTGSTPANRNDYKLDSPITSGLSITNYQNYTPLILEEVPGKYAVCASYVLKNTTESEINIWEIGLITPCDVGINKFWQVLMERTVLTEPITIAPGEAKLVTYKITFNQTLNVE